MKKLLALFLMILLAGAMSCAPALKGGKQKPRPAESCPAASFMEAIEQSAGKIAETLPKGGRVAIVAFESESASLSDFIMEELAGALVDRGIQVAARNSQNLKFIEDEFGYQMSKSVSDEDARTVGKFLAADMAVTGQLLNMDNTYRYRTSAVSVEQAARAGVTRLDISNSAEMQNMAASLASRQTAEKATKYGVDEQKTPQTAGAFLDRGILLAVRGEYEPAIKDFTEALKIKPDLASAYALRGKARLAEVAAIDADFSKIRINLGKKLTAEQAKACDQAIDDLTQAMRLDSQNSALYLVERGRVHVLKDEPDKAAADLNQAIRLNPNSATAYNNRAIMYARKKDFNKAIADYNKAIRLDPEFVDAYINRGETYSDKGDYDKAIADFNQATRLDSNSAEAYYNRGSMHFDKGDYDKAIADYNQAIRLNPNDAEAYGNRGSMHFNKGDYDKAIADFNQAIRLDSGYAAVYYNRGNAYLNKDDFDKAIADYNQAIRLDPNDADTYNNRGNAHVYKGNYDKGIADYKAALQIDPKHASAKENLENARQRRGR